MREGTSVLHTHPASKSHFQNEPYMDFNLLVLHVTSFAVTVLSMQCLLLTRGFGVVTTQTAIFLASLFHTRLKHLARFSLSPRTKSLLKVHSYGSRVTGISN